MKSNVVGTGRSLQALSGAGNSVDSIVTAVEQISTRVAQVSCQVQESSKMIRDAVAKTDVQSVTLSISKKRLVTSVK